MWIIIGILDGTHVTPDGKRFENVQVIARASTQPNESVWQALVRQAENDTYIADLLSYRSKGSWESIIAYELMGTRLEPDEAGVQVLEALAGSKTDSV